MSTPVDVVMNFIQDEKVFTIYERVELISRLLRCFSDRGQLVEVLQFLTSREWMILYKAVLEVEAGL